jgi:hypothetical protein
MGAFDHIIVLLSFVYAMAIAHLLSTTAALIRRGPAVRLSALHGFWMLNALLTIMANWIGFWDLRSLPSWPIATIFFTFVIAFSNYLQSALVCPEVGAEGPLDLVTFQAEQRRRIMASWTASAATALAGNVVYGGGFSIATWSQANLAVGPMVASGLVGLLWRARLAQVAAAAIAAVAWIVYFAALQPAIR